MEHAALRKDRVKGLSRCEEESEQHPDVRDIRQRRTIVCHPTLKPNQTSTNKEQHQQDREQKRDKWWSDEHESTIGAYTESAQQGHCQKEHRKHNETYERAIPGSIICD